MPGTSQTRKKIEKNQRTSSWTSNAGGFVEEFETEAVLTGVNIVNDACGSTIAELTESMALGNTYVNLHSTNFPAGEVRGQIFLDY